jgi:hypothetical protein
MARAIPLISGSRIYAGANLPFFVSQGMVTSYLAARGFTDVQWHKRSESLPAGLDPTKDPQYDDDWDVWAEAQYAGLQSGTLNPPANPAWMRVELPGTATSAISSPATAAPSAATLPPPLGLGSGAAAPQTAAIVADPVIVRRRRLGVVVAVLGGILAASGVGWTIMAKRLPEPLVASGEPPEL